MRGVGVLGAAALIAIETPPPPPPPDEIVPGAVALGGTNYPIPAPGSPNTLYVSTTGNNANAGTSIGAPKRTVAGALSAAIGGTIDANNQLTSRGSTIVLMEGSYNENCSTAKHGLTIQAYPGDVVWMDGSRTVTAWTASGGKWWATNTVEFPNGASFSPGAHDAGWIDPAFPMASYPDRVYFNGVSQPQVSTLAACTAGKCFFDYAADRVYVGSDPTSVVAKVGNLTNAFTISGFHCVLRGFGVHYYSNNVSAYGAIILARSGCQVENLWIEDIANVGITIGHSSSNGKAQIVNQCTIRRCGHLGIHGNWCDGAQILNSHVEECNYERYRTAPSAAGIKITHARGILINNMTIINNYSYGIWTDESVYDMGVYNCELENNTKAEITFELSGNIVLANCTINGGNTSETAVWIYTSGNIKVLNCSITGGILHDLQNRTDTRRPTVGFTSSGQRDQRYTNWATYATGWHWDGVDIFNNVFAVEGSPNPRSLWVQAVAGATNNPDSAVGQFYRNNYVPNRGAAGGTALMMYFTAGPSGSNTWHTVASVVAHNAAWSGNVQSAGAHDLATMLAAAQDSWARATPSKATIYSEFDATGVISATTGVTSGTAFAVTTADLFDVEAYTGIAAGSQVMGPV